LPDTIAELEAEQESLERALSAPTIYADDPARAAELGARLMAVESEWAEAMERLDALQHQQKSTA
jgi:hypothetical protein